MMKNLNDVIDIGSKKAGSDYKLAPVLGVSRAAISGWRKKGSLDNENAAKLAEYTGVDFQEIIAMSEAAKHPEKAQFWGRMIAASVILSLGIVGFSATNSMSYITPWLDSNIHYASFK